MVYVAKKKDGTLVHHTSKEAMKALDGISKPDWEVTDAEYEAANGLMRIINGELFLGKTDAEKAAEKKEAEDTARVSFLKTQLAATDYIAAKIAEGSATKAEYAEKIAQRQAWRGEINRLEKKELTGVAG